MKLWAKIYDEEEKMRVNIMRSNTASLTRTNYEVFLAELCNELDISTPVSLASHYMQIVRFNHAKYFPRDFVEPVNFVKFIVELTDV